MKYELLWFQRAVDNLMDLSGRDRRQALRILIAIRTFEREGSGDIKKLQDGSGDWRLRQGDWRVHMVLEGGRAIMTRIDNRRDAY